MTLWTVYHMVAAHITWRQRATWRQRTAWREAPHGGSAPHGGKHRMEGSIAGLPPLEEQPGMPAGD